MTARARGRWKAARSGRRACGSGDRAQRLSDRAREQAGAERAAAERSERLIDEQGDPGSLTFIVRWPRCIAKPSGSTRGPVSYSVSTRTMSAGRPKGNGPGSIPTRAPTGRSARFTADEREHQADLREEAADDRERLADKREGLADERERDFDATSGRWTSHQREHLVRAKATLRRLGAGLARRAEALSRSDARDARDAAAIEREIADTNHSATSHVNAPTDDAPKP